MKRSTFLKSLLAIPVAVKALGKPQPDGATSPVTGKFMSFDEMDKGIGLTHMHNLKAKGGYLVPPEWAYEIEAAMSKYPG